MSTPVPSMPSMPSIKQNIFRFSLADLLIVFFCIWSGLLNAQSQTVPTDLSIISTTFSADASYVHASMTLAEPPIRLPINLSVDVDNHVEYQFQFVFDLDNSGDRSVNDIASSNSKCNSD